MTNVENIIHGIIPILSFRSSGKTLCGTWGDPLLLKDSLQKNSENKLRLNFITFALKNKPDAVAYLLIVIFIPLFFYFISTVQ